jgi:hypothetical protein
MLKSREVVVEVEDVSLEPIVVVGEGEAEDMPHP